MATSESIRFSGRHTTPVEVVQIAFDLALLALGAIEGWMPVAPSWLSSSFVVLEFTRSTAFGARVRFMPGGFNAPRDGHRAPPSGEREAGRTRRLNLRPPQKSRRPRSG